jgi:hypothetical protein
MRIEDAFLCIVLAAAGAHSQFAAPKAGTATPDASAIVGVWRGQTDGLPGVALTITNESGTLSGAILFYFHRREDGQPWASTPGIPEPLFNLGFIGKTLTFQVSHRRAHPPRTLNDPPVTFRLSLSGANNGGLTNESELRSGRGNAGSSGLPIVRTDY